MKDLSEEKNKKVDTVKRVLALALAAVLVILYLSTVYFAITDDPKTMGLFKASVALTILVPIMIYAYQLVFRVMKSLNGENKKISDDSIDRN